MVEVAELPYNRLNMMGNGNRSGVGVRLRGLCDFTKGSLDDLLATWEEPAYRAQQILEWVYGRGVSDYDEMSNLPKSLRSRLRAEWPLFTSTMRGTW